MPEPQTTDPKPETRNPKPGLRLEICALDRPPRRFEVRQVDVPGVEGPFTVLPGHASLLSNLTIGPLTAVMPDGQKQSAALNGGVARVVNAPPQGEAHVLILTQTAEMDTEIDLERARAARERAQQRLSEASGIARVPEASSSSGTTDVARAEAALKRAMVRIRIGEGNRPKSASPIKPSQ